MYIIPIAWLYVAVMMAVAEATNSNGSILGAIITFLLYGLLPVSLVVYLMGSPGRRKARKAREAAPTDAPPDAAASPLPDMAATLDVSGHPDAGRHAATATEHDVVTPVRKEP